MDEATVTIPLSEYNQLRDNAATNHMFIDKIVGYEVQVNNIQQQLFEIGNKIFALENKIKEEQR